MVTGSRKWWAARAYNSETQYGFGTEAEAHKWCDLLNRLREYNQYSPEIVDDETLIGCLDSDPAAGEDLDALIYEDRTDQQRGRVAAMEGRMMAEETRCREWEPTGDGSGRRIAPRGTCNCVECRNEREVLADMTEADKYDVLADLEHEGQG